MGISTCQCCIVKIRRRKKNDKINEQKEREIKKHKTKIRSPYPKFGHLPLSLKSKFLHENNNIVKIEMDKTVKL